MQQDRVGLGRKGEIFVMKKINEQGWVFPADYRDCMIGLDWVFEKDGRLIKVQVKTTLKKNIQFTITRHTFDYLVVTDLNDLWIIPQEILGVGANRLTKMLRLCKGKMEFLDLSGKELLSRLIDCGIPPCEFVNTTHIFFPQKVSSKLEEAVQRLKVAAKVNG